MIKGVTSECEISLKFAFRCSFHTDMIINDNKHLLYSVAMLLKDILPSMISLCAQLTEI